MPASRDIPRTRPIAFSRSPRPRTRPSLVRRGVATRLPAKTQARHQEGPVPPAGMRSPNGGFAAGRCHASWRRQPFPRGSRAEQGTRRRTPPIAGSAGCGIVSGECPMLVRFLADRTVGQPEHRRHLVSRSWDWSHGKAVRNMRGFGQWRRWLTARGRGIGESVQGEGDANMPGLHVPDGTTRFGTAPQAGSKPDRRHIHSAETPSGPLRARVARWDPRAIKDHGKVRPPAKNLRARNGGEAYAAPRITRGPHPGRPRRLSESHRRRAARRSPRIGVRADRPGSAPLSPAATGTSVNSRYQSAGAAGSRRRPGRAPSPGRGPRPTPRSVSAPTRRRSS